MREVVVAFLFLMGMLLWMSIGFELSEAAEPYLKPSETKLDKRSAQIGEPISAFVTLERTGRIPEEAALNYTTDLNIPRLEVWIDDVGPEVYGAPSFQIPLPSEGVRKIDIRLSGTAPSVAQLTDITVLSLSVYVKYKGEDPEYQDAGTLTLTVFSKELKEVNIAIDNAWDKYNEARRKIQILKDRGVNTVPLEAQLQDARTQIELAETAESQGEVETASKNANLAISALDRLISEADEMGAGPAPLELRRYLTIAGAVIIALLLIIFLRGRREELG
jgi:hypothetical protein